MPVRFRKEPHRDFRNGAEPGVALAEATMSTKNTTDTTTTRTRATDERAAAAARDSFAARMARWDADRVADEASQPERFDGGEA
jgi:hypothetical protein